MVDLPEMEDGGERGELTAPEHKVSSVRGIGEASRGKRVSHDESTECDEDKEQD